MAAPGWTSAEELGLDEFSSVELTPEDELLHDALVDRVIEGTGLYEDTDGDLAVDPEEREAGALADTAEPEPPASEGDDDDDDGMSGSGCRSSLAGGEASIVAVLLLAVAAVRRRRP
jgi:hypothetical protein